MHIKSHIKTWAKTQVHLEKIEKKKIRAENKNSISEYEKELKNKENIILSESKAKEKMMKLNEFLLTRETKVTDTEYSLKKSCYFFTIMKNRYLDTKNKLKKLTNNIKNINLRRGLKDMKLYYLESFKITSLRNMLISSFKKLGFRTLNNVFDRWYRNTWHCYGQRLKKSLKEVNEKVTLASSQNKLIKTKNRQKALKILIGKTKTVVLTEWKKVSKLLKAIKNSNKKFENFAKAGRLTFSLKTLKKNAKKSILKKKNIKRSENIFSKRLTEFHFLS